MMEDYIAALEKRIADLERNQSSILKVLWDMRGQAKGEAAKIERELESAWNEYLEKYKISV